MLFIWCPSFSAFSLPLPCPFSSSTCFFLQQPLLSVGCFLWVRLVKFSHKLSLYFVSDCHGYVTDLPPAVRSFHASSLRWASNTYSTAVSDLHRSGSLPTAILPALGSIPAFPCFVGSLLFFIFLVCVCFQVMRRRSSPCLFATHCPLLCLFQHPHHDELPAPLPFLILNLCAISVRFLCFFNLLFTSLYCCLSLVVFVIFMCFFFVLFYFSLLTCNKALFSLTRIQSPSVFNFGHNLWVMDIIVILTFGSRWKSFSMRIFPLLGSRNNSYPCIWLSIPGAYLVLNLKFSHELTNWYWLYVVFIIFYADNRVTLCYGC